MEAGISTSPSPWPAHDDEARAILQNVSPNHEIVGVERHEIILGGGNIHCITQQVPSTFQT